MDEEQVEIVHFEVLQALQECRTDFFGAVVGVPKLRCHEEILAGHHPLLQDHRKGVADLVLVLVVCGAIDVPVA